jgi:hypothetical protein
LVELGINGRGHVRHAPSLTQRTNAGRGNVPGAEINNPSMVGPAVAATIIPAASTIATARTVTAAAGVAAITTAPIVDVVATVIVAIISLITRRAIAAITPIRLNGACKSPHHQHCENRAQHDTSPAFLRVRITGIVVPALESSKPSMGSW